MEKYAEEAKQLGREVEKMKRKEEKKMLEERGAFIRWVTGFIVENTDKWEMDREIRKEERKLKLEEWERMPKKEKIEVLRKRENLGDKRERNTRIWREWRTAYKDNEIMLEDKEKSSSSYPSLIDVHSLEMRPIIRRPRLVFTMQEMPAKHRTNRPR